MEEYAINNIPEIASKDPLRLLDLGNDAQIIVDKINKNPTGETDRASENMKHALGKPYSVKEVAFNTLTNLSPYALGALMSMLKSGVGALGKGVRVGIKTAKAEPYYKISDGVVKSITTGKPSKASWVDKVKKMKEGTTYSRSGAKTGSIDAAMKRGTKQIVEAVLDNAPAAALKQVGKAAVTKGSYGATRPVVNDSMLKPIILSIFSADMDDPARYNQADVEKAHKMIFGEEGFNDAMNEGASPRKLIMEIKAFVKEHPEVQKQILSDYEGLDD